jgi:hypothetical protein
MKTARRTGRPAAAYSLCVTVWFLCAGCVSTPFGNKAYQTLTDFQLVLELKDIYGQLGIGRDAIVRVQGLIDAIPPSLVIKGEAFTQFSAIATTTGDTTLISGTAVTTSTYRIYDANAVQRDIARLAQNIQLARQTALNSRRIRAENEIFARVTRREEEARKLFRNFFFDHPTLRGEIPLLAAAYPWVREKDLAASLDAVARNAEPCVVAKRGGELTGVWYGSLDYRVSTSDKKGDPTRSPARATLSREGDQFVLNVESPDRPLGVLRGFLDSSGNFAGAARETAGQDKAALEVSGTIAPDVAKLRIHGTMPFSTETMEAYLELVR